MMAYGWTADYVRFELSGAQGWAYLAYAKEHMATVWGSGYSRSSPGYIKQEIERLLKCR